MGCAIGRIAEIMERWAPLASAEPGDNCGLLCGDASRETEGILVSLDVTEDVIDRARETGAGLVVSHHPFLYRPILAVSAGTAAGRLAIRAIEAGVALYAAHTNLDRAQGGVNDALCAAVGLRVAVPAAEGSIGRLAVLPEPRALDAFAAHVRRALDAPPVRVTGRGDGPVSRVYIVSGAGRHDVPLAVAAGADCMLTGEIGYHDALDARAAGLCVVEAGHYHTERPVLNWIEGHLQSRLQRLQYTVRTAVYGDSTCPFHPVE